MKLLIAIAIAVPVVLTGCSSAPVKTTQRQYCHTSQEIKTRDRETVSSETTVKCNDDPIEQMVVRKMGIAANCGEYKYVMNLNGRPVERIGYACQKYNGTWEVVPHPSMYQ
jgi:uncharacterized protein YceK